MDDSGELDRVCANCSYSFPAEQGVSEESICLKDPDFEPYIDRLLDKGDFACCAELIKRKRFPLDREACDEFEPAEFGDSETSPELSADLDALAAAGELTRENIEASFAAEALRRADWSRAPAGGYVERLHNARTVREREEAIDSLGALVAHGNRQAFSALLAYLRSLPPAKTPDDCRFRTELLRQLSWRSQFEAETAQAVADDLLRTKSNNQTRSWFTAAWRFFERCSDEVRQEALQPILDSPKFSYRIKRVVRNIIDFGSRYG